jgi:hypothetical protein
VTNVEIKWINLERSSLRTGTLLLDRSQLTNQLTFWELVTLQWFPGDRMGKVLREQFVKSPDSVRQHAEPYWATQTLAEHLQEIGREYEELYAAFSVTPASDWQEDYCLYKVMESRRRYFQHVSGHWYCYCCYLAFALACVALMWTFNCPWWLLPILALSLLGLCILPLPVYRYRAGAAALWSLVAGRMLLGHGVVIHRAIISLFGIIAIFAGIYLASSVLNEQGIGTGRIVYALDGRDLSILEKKYGTDPEKVVFDSADNVARRATYFSAVTFTTLGYGDCRPEGRLQYVAALEAVTGAIFLAMFTVIFARKLLRL